MGGCKLNFHNTVSETQNANDQYAVLQNGTAGREEQVSEQVRSAMVMLNME